MMKIIIAHVSGTHKDEISLHAISVMLSLSNLIECPPYVLSLRPGAVVYKYLDGARRKSTF